MKRVCSIGLILIGLCVIAYPKVRDAYYDKKEAEILDAWEKVSFELEQRQPDKELPSEDVWDKIKPEDIDGVLEIEKIRLKEPIFKKLTENNLYLGVAKIKEEVEAGTVGCYSVAGHRNRTYGRHFNRLGEIQKGDIIKITTAQDAYTYEVYEVLIVKAEDSWVIEGNGEDSLITLVTCDYSMKPTARLVVRGKLLLEDSSLP